MDFVKRRMETKEGVDALFLYATEGILVVNEKGEIVRINPSAEKLFGYPQEYLLGKKIEALIPQRFSAKHEKYRTDYAEKPYARSMGAGMELYGLRKDGTEFPLEISLSPYSTNEGKFVIAFILDITLKKQSEERLKNYSMELERQVRNRTLVLEEAIDELEKTKLELRKALEKEKELNEMKSRFVSMASHEFRTPLTTMMSSLSLTSKYSAQNDLTNQEKHIQKIKNSIHNMTDILNDFLSVSKLEEGKIVNMPLELNLKTLISEIVGEIEALTTKDHTLVYTHQGPEMVELDAKLLQGVLFNLLSNAIKFSPEGGNIDLNSTVSNDEISISVKDSGIGISKEDQQHLFERFFRGQNATHIQGTGLGLNIISSYLKLMEGTIQIDSEENKGTLFTVIFKK